MRILYSRRSRAIFGMVLGILAVMAWVRFESRIAETPRISESVADASVNQVVTPPTVVIPSRSAAPSRSFMRRMEESPTESSGDLSIPRSLSPIGDSTRDDVQKKSEIRNSSLVILEVPFVSQAPFRIWDLPYKEFCEEASVYSLHLWKEGKPTPPADELDRALKDIQAWEMANLRTWEDTTADETARILKEKFGYANTKVVRGIGIAEMLDQLAHGTPIIVPAAGRELSSPYYRPPGPLYHMVVVIGFDDEREEFITNDVGTNTKGASFRFTYDNLYGAMGDWDIASGAPDTSQKVMIVLE